MSRKRATALTSEKASSLTDIPNVGPATARDLMLLGINRPEQLPGLDPFEMYDDLCRLTEKPHDPCVIDVFIAAVKFMEGEPARKWWHYTAERKKRLALQLGQ